MFQCLYSFRFGPNILLNNIKDYSRPSVWQCLSWLDRTDLDAAPVAALRDFDNSIVSGFQLATLSGPMCEEPLMGVCFSIERWDVLSSAHQNPPKNQTSETSTDGSEDGTAGSQQRTDSSDCYGPVSGQLIAAMKEACRHAFQAQPQRLMAAMYTCEIIATADVLGEKII